MNILVFSTKTIPDIDGCRRLYDLHGLSEDDVVKAVTHKRRQQANTELLPHHLYKIVAISAVLKSGDQFRVWSLGDRESTEEDLLQRFFSGIQRYTPKLVSWNGLGFHLPVIHYRSLLYPINAAQYWAGGDSHGADQQHIDLVDVLAARSSPADASLEDIASLCGFPGKMSLDAPETWAMYHDNEFKKIRDHCEIDVLNNYLVFLNYQRNNGDLNSDQYQQACQSVRDALIASGYSHLEAFEKNWIEW